MEKFLTKKPRDNNNALPDFGNGRGMPETAENKRKFRSEWLTSFAWLSNKDGSAFCEACNKGVVNHLSHLKRHEAVTSHVQNIEAKKKQISMDSFLDTNKRQMHKMVQNAELTLVMFLITHNLPFRLMDNLPELLAECCPDSEVAKQLKIARTRAAQLTEKLSFNTMKALISELKSCKFSLIIDETTDVSAKKCLVLVVRYVANLVVRDRFLALIELPKCDADSIFASIKDFFHTYEIPIDNIIGLATDGASVMAGHLKSVRALFEAETDIFYLKCTCHSLHLCTSYACKKLPQDIEWLCRNIYAFFSHSPKRIYDFIEFQNYCEVKPHKILVISHTRWLSLESVISRILEQWDSLKLFFISSKLEVNALRSDQLAEKMSNETKVYFLFLSYVLPVINNMNKDFQSEQSRLPYLYCNIKSNFLLILNNFIRKGTPLQVDTDYKNVSNYMKKENIFIGSKAEIFLSKTILTPAQRIEIKNNILKFYIELLDQIKMRFDFSRKDLELLKIITPVEVLSDKDSCIFDLILKFQYLSDDNDKIITQWTLLKLSNHNLKSNSDINSFWQSVGSLKNGLGELMFPELTNFIFNLLTLPHSSAAAERKFSSVNLIKTKLRNKLGIETINNIMVCKELVKNEIHKVWSAEKDYKPIK